MVSIATPPGMVFSRTFQTKRAADRWAKRTRGVVRAIVRKGRKRPDGYIVFIPESRRRR